MTVGSTAGPSAPAIAASRGYDSAQSVLLQTAIGQGSVVPPFALASLPAVVTPTGEVPTEIAYHDTASEEPTGDLLSLDESTLLSAAGNLPLPVPPTALRLQPLPHVNGISATLFADVVPSDAEGSRLSVDAAGPVAAGMNLLMAGEQPPLAALQPAPPVALLSTPAPVMAALPPIPAAAAQGDAEEWAARVADIIAQRAVEVPTSARFQLTPAYLGEIDVRVELDRSTVVVELVPQSEPARQALDPLLPRLTRMLEARDMAMLPPDTTGGGAASGSGSQPQTRQPAVPQHVPARLAEQSPVAAEPARRAPVPRAGRVEILA
jgi:hypothetical protein